MSKKTIILVLATIIIVAAVCTIIIPGKIAGDKVSTAQEETTEKPEIVCVQEADGSVTYHVPLTIKNTQTGETETQWFTANSSDLPARILIQNGDEEMCILFNVDEDGNTSIKLTPTDSELEGMADA